MISKEHYVKLTASAEAATESLKKLEVSFRDLEGVTIKMMAIEDVLLVEHKVVPGQKPWQWFGLGSVYPVRGDFESNQFEVRNAVGEWVKGDWSGFVVWNNMPFDPGQIVKVINPHIEPDVYNQINPMKLDEEALTIFIYETGHVEVMRDSGDYVVLPKHYFEYVCESE